jgi:hypothetical protein
VVIPRRSREGAAAFLVYAVVAAAFLGPELARAGSGRTYVGLKVDPQIFIWAFAWWPHAIVHGQNPIVTHAIWAPDGIDLAWTTSVPGLALLFWPLTAVAGPLASFDVASILMPAAAAWAAFLLCRHVTRAFWPSLAGGYLFGFSSYVLCQLQEHLFLTAVFVVPLFALVVLRYLDGELSRGGLAWRFGLLMALQLTISTEVALTASLALATSLVLGFLLAPARRRRIVRAVPPLVGAYVVAFAVVAPLTWYWATDFTRGRVNPIAPDHYTLDWLNLLVPTRVTGLGHWWSQGIAHRFLAGDEESGAYLGLPLVAIVVWFGVRRWRTASARFLVAAIAVTLVAGSGTWLQIGGYRLITMPWEHVVYLPLFNNILPVRLAVFIALAAAVAAASWASSRGPSLGVRVGAVALAILFVLPNYGMSWAASVHEPAFVRDETYRSCIRRNENIAVFPFSRHGNSMLWQADAGFWFRQAGGYVAPLPPKPFQSPQGVADVAEFGDRAEQVVGPMLQLVRLKHVDVLVVDGGDAEPWRSLLAPARKPLEVAGALLYRFRGTTPDACA